MNEKPLENLEPITIVLSEEDFNSLLALLDKEPTDEQSAKLAELMSRPQRIKSGRDELR